MSILNEIIEYKKLVVQEQSSVCPQDELIELAHAQKPVNSFINRLESNGQDKMALIAEVKKASPSKGIIRADFDPVATSLDYEQGGASAISVLTDEKYFKGSIDYLKQVRSAVSLPILRKDFIVDPYQIYQTRAIRADMILLIASALEFPVLKDYYQLSKELGLDVLVEVHDDREMEFALGMGAKLIGVNNRNLSNFNVSLDNTLNLINCHNVEGRLIISESGINSFKDIETFKKAGVAGILVGEHLMRQADIKKGIGELLGKYR